MWLIIVSIDTDIDLDELEFQLKVKHGNLEPADGIAHAEYLGCTIVELNLFSIINDYEHKVKLLID